MTTYEVPKRIADNIARRAANRQPGACIYGCDGSARLYPGGRFCPDHAPGHNPTPDPAATAAALRDQGAARVDANTDLDWKQQVDAAIEQLARGGQPFTADDVRALGIPDPPSPQAWGARFLAASKAKRIRQVGFQASQRASVHAHRIAIWQGAA